jgi:hypothetical protein
MNGDGFFGWLSPEFFFYSFVVMGVLCRAGT